MLSTAEGLEDSINDSFTSWKVNVVEFNYLDPYTQVDSLYVEVTELSSFMKEQGLDIDVFQDMFECKQAFQKENPQSKERIRRALTGTPC